MGWLGDFLSGGKNKTRAEIGERIVFLCVAWNCETS